MIDDLSYVCDRMITIDLKILKKSTKQVLNNTKFLYHTVFTDGKNYVCSTEWNNTILESYNENDVVKLINVYFEEEKQEYFIQFNDRSICLKINDDSECEYSKQKIN